MACRDAMCSGHREIEMRELRPMSVSYCSATAGDKVCEAGREAGLFCPVEPFVSDVRAVAGVDQTSKSVPGCSDP
eukprot:jgi/Tetstr1/465864/TSEL_010482.t1